MFHVQPKVPLEGIEVAVIVQETISIHDAKRGQQTVDCAAYGDASAAQRTEILCRQNRKFGGHSIEYGYRPEMRQCLLKSTLQPNPLECLGENQGCEPDRFVFMPAQKPNCLRRPSLI